MQQQHQAMRGLASSLFASCLFGLIYYYAVLLKPLNGLEIYGWRILATLPCLSVIMIASGYWPLIREIFSRIGTRRVLLAPLLLSACLLGVQFWLFMWAPLNGMALDVSLGYLLMPLVMVVCGRLVYKERLHPFQKLAVVCAALGVANQLFRTGRISWAVIVVATGFPLYFLLRRKIRTDNLGGLWFDMVLMTPVALWFVAGMDAAWDTLLHFPRLFLLIPFLGILSAAATACYILASRLLPLGIFGLLSYAEPVLLVVVSLLLGESLEPGEGFTYVGVGLAIGILAVGGLQHMHSDRRTV